MARYTYVMSDIHGQFDAFMKMLEQIDFTEDDELYILGDVVDRGPKSIECIKWIMAQDNVLTLLGNHELMLYDGYINDAPALYQSLDEIRTQLSDAEQKNIIRWIETMPECKLITVNGKKFYLNHTQPVTPEYFKQNMTQRMFPNHSIYKHCKATPVKDVICIHGHIPTMQMRMWHGEGNSSLIWKNTNETVIDIDCGAGYPKEGGRLGCVRLNDMREFYEEV